MLHVAYAIASQRRFLTNEDKQIQLYNFCKFHVLFSGLLFSVFFMRYFQNFRDTVYNQCFRINFLSLNLSLTVMVLFRG